MTDVAPAHRALARVAIDNSREVAPCLESGGFAQAIQTTRAAIGDAATRMARDHQVVADPLLRTPEIVSVFERFSEVIPEMIVARHFLEQMLDHAWGPCFYGRTTPVLRAKTHGH